MFVYPFGEISPAEFGFEKLPRFSKVLFLIFSFISVGLMVPATYYFGGYTHLMST